MPQYWWIGDPLMIFFEKKVPQCWKNLKGGRFGIFSIHSVTKLQKNWRGSFGIFFFEKKCSTMPKDSKVVPFSLARYCMLRGKKEKLFWFSSLGQQVHFGDTLKFCRTFSRTILVTSGVSKKTLTKSHDYSRLFYHMKAPNEIEKLLSKLTVIQTWD